MRLLKSLSLNKMTNCEQFACAEPSRGMTVKKIII